MSTIVPNIVDEVEFEQDYEGMLRRALERIIQLYTDKSHFVYELLQNAEDAGAKSIKFVQFSDRLEVLHDGKPFTMQNLKSLCDIGLSDKADDYNKIGEFGVGFKSVFGICETVKLYSEPSNYRDGHIEGALRFAKEIVDFVKHRNIPFENLPTAYTTRFVFPYTVGKSFSGYSTTKELKSVLCSKLQDLGVTTLLFMKHLESIEYRIEIDENIIEGQYLLEKKVINDHCYLASALGVSNVKGSEESGDNIIHYLRFSRPIDESSIRTVDIAFPVKLLENGGYECVKPRDPYISVYFPTETESKLGFIVQGPYRTTPNRSSIPANDKDNIYLAQQTAILLREAILELRDTEKFNMSFVKSLPLVENAFDNFNLFYPLYETVKSLFVSEKIIPTHNGEYTSAREAKLPRPERLTTLFTDELLTSLHADGTRYKWLPAFLTETNAEYEHVYKYVTGELKIGIVRPENLRLLFDKNPRFLPQRTNDWLVELYSVYENVPATFAKNKGEANTLTCCIVKTTNGRFVAPYRRMDNKQLIPNVFVYTEGIDDPDIHFVEPELYARCKDFFDNVLQVQKPNEYEFFVKDIRRRYNEQYIFDAEKHSEDFKKLLKFLKRDEYRDEVIKIIQENFLVCCNDGVMRSPYMTTIYLSKGEDKIEIEQYLRNIAPNVKFVDKDYYISHEISVDMLKAVGIRDTLIKGEQIVHGIYDNGKPGRQPEWWVSGDFRWKFTIEYIKDALLYISRNPEKKDSVVKSQVIMTILLQNESKLAGVLHIGGAIGKMQTFCELISVLKGEKLFGWNGKWLYTDSEKLVAPDEISKHQLNPFYYGKPKAESVLYDLLGFKKTEADEVEAIKKDIPQDKLDALLDFELKSRFGISLEDIKGIGGGTGTGTGTDVDDPEDDYVFPVAKVKNWNALRKHVAEVLSYAEPVKYGFVIRHIRVSNKPQEARSYLMNMYRYIGTSKYACQLCHDATSDIKAVQLFPDEKKFELDAMHICLCPNCEPKYKRISHKKNVMDVLLNDFLELEEPSDDESVAMMVEDEQIWFTHIHFAEIRELLKLMKEIESRKPNEEAIDATNEDEESGLNVYEALIGKTITRRDGFKGRIESIVGEFAVVKILPPVREADKGKESTKVGLQYIIDPKIYTIN